MINDLRSLTIHAVDCITVWRDQFRQLAAIGGGGNQSKNLKRLVSNKMPFLVPGDGFDSNSVSITTPGTNLVNYLNKMKSDTSHFGSLSIAKRFNFCERNKSDPFLLTAGKQKAGIAQGSGITAM